MKEYLIWAAAILLLTLVGCGTVLPPDQEAELTALREADARGQQAVVAKDADAFASLLAEGAKNYAPNAPPDVGREAIRRSFEKAFAQLVITASYPEPSKVVVSSSGDLGYTAVVEELTINDAEGNPTTVHTQVLAVWRKEPDGTWKVIENMWNYSEPFPASD